MGSVRLINIVIIIISIIIIITRPTSCTLPKNGVLLLSVTTDCSQVLLCYTKGISQRNDAF